MRLPIVTRRRHQRELDHQRRGYELVIKQVGRENSHARQRLAFELSTCKDIVASHIVAAGHPSTVLHDVHAFADALEQALTDAGVDIRIELDRLKGVEL